MITLQTLDYLSAQKVKDALVLFRNGRYNAAIYLMGYALEFRLKKKLSNTLGFTQGFPENKTELNRYLSYLTRFHSLSTGITLAHIKDIRTHDLNKLLIFSGAEVKIKSSHYANWLLAKNWNPENRYIVHRYTTAKAAAFLKAAKKILQQIT